MFPMYCVCLFFATSWQSSHNKREILSQIARRWSDSVSIFWCLIMNYDKYCIKTCLQSKWCFLYVDVGDSVHVCYCGNGNVFVFVSIFVWCFLALYFVYCGLFHEMSISSIIAHTYANKYGFVHLFKSRNLWITILKRSAVESPNCKWSKDRI